MLKLLADVLFDKNRIPAVIAEYNKQAVENQKSGESERSSLKKAIRKTEREIENIVSVIASSGSAALAAALEKKEKELSSQKIQLDTINRKSTELNVAKEQIVQAFSYSRELIISGKLPKLKQLINLYVERIDVYPDVVNVTLNIIGGIKAKADNEELARLGEVYEDSLTIHDSVTRSKIIKEYR